MAEQAPLVGIIMGSVSEMETVADARDTLRELEVPAELRVLSAHRTPDESCKYAQTAADRGLKVIIAAAGGAAHLPGVIAAKTLLPVIGVPMLSKSVGGIDSLLSIAQMPAGVPVATVGIGNATNAALLAARILALEDDGVRRRLANYVQRMREKVLSIKL